MLVLLVVQFVLPRFVAGRVEDRLTEDGGTAEVSVSALPAPRLLFTEGDEIRVRAREVELPVASPDRKVFEKLDGFDDVDVRVTEARAGPLKLSLVSLERRGGDRPYRTTIRGMTTARDLASFGAGQMAGPLGGFLGSLAGDAFPFADQQVPIDLEAVIRSDDGRPRVVTVEGTVAGVPAGPLAAALAQAIAGRF